MANLTFPNNPTNGQKVTVNDKVFVYNSTTSRWTATRLQVLGNLTDDFTIDAPTLGVSLSTVALDTVGANVYITYTVDQDVKATLTTSGLENTTATLYQTNNTIVVTAGATDFANGQISLVVNNGRSTDTEVINVSAAYVDKLSDPSSPTFVKSLARTALNNYGNDMHMQLLNDGSVKVYVVADANERLETFTVTPSTGNFVFSGAFTGYNNSTAVRVSGAPNGDIFLAPGGGNMIYIETASGSRLSVSETDINNGNIFGIGNGYAYAFAGSSTSITDQHILNYTSGTNIVKTSGISTSGSSSGPIRKCWNNFDLDNNYMYIATQYRILRYDISNPSSLPGPQFMVHGGNLASAAFDIKNGLMYYYDGPAEKIKVVDFSTWTSTQTAPQIFVSTTDAGAFDAKDNYLYLKTQFSGTDGDGEIEIYDFSDKSNITKVATIDVPQFTDEYGNPTQTTYGGKIPGSDDRGVAFGNGVLMIMTRIATGAGLHSYT